MDAAIFGLIVADVIGVPIDLRSPPSPGGLKLIDSITLTTGGNVCNTAIAMARLGLRVAAAGLVGDDVLGAAMTESLRRAGVDTSAVFANNKDQTSATCVAVEPGGERCFFHTPGVTRLLDPDTLRKCFPIFATCKYVQIGYFGLLPGLTRELPALLAELKRAAPQTKLALETVTPVGPWNELEPILPHLDLFVPSRSEAVDLTGERDPKKMIAAFRKHLPRGLIGIKLDAEGCLLDDGATQELVPSYRIDVVDTTGAGDTWFAGLLTGLIRGMSIREAGKLANRVAADCCTKLGASAGIQSLEQSLARL